MGYMKSLAIDIENGERLEWVPLMHEDMDSYDAYAPEWAGDDVELFAIVRTAEPDNLSSPFGDAWFLRDGREFYAPRAFVEWIVSK